MYRDYMMDEDVMMDAGCLYQRQQQQYSPPAHTPLQHVCDLNIDKEPPFVRMTNIVCTIGQSCDNPNTLRRMVMAGMNIARLNLTLGSYKYHTDVMKMIRDLEKATPLKQSIGIAVDITSPTVRTGLINNDLDATVNIVEGSTVHLTTNPEVETQCTADRIWIDKVYFPDVIVAMNIGDRIHIDDGALTFIVREKGIDHVRCLVEQGGVLGSSKRCQLPRPNLYKHAVAAKYRQNLLFAVENEVDFIFASFIETAKDLHKMKEVLGEVGRAIKILVKVETRQTVDNIGDILEVADGVIISRGDLGLELPPEKVFIVQKSIIARALCHQKPAFVAGQMLESMRFKPRPTRAEASDVANAVLDGADGLFLTVETAKGNYPVESVVTMHQIAREAESAVFHERVFLELKRSRLAPHIDNSDHSTAVAAVEASMKAQASAIIVVTTTGKLAQIIASYRPVCPILTVTRKSQVARLCHLYRGLHAIQYHGDKLEDWSEDMDRRINHAFHVGRQRGFFMDNDRVVVVNGWVAGNNSTVRIFCVPPTDETLAVVSSK